MTLVLSIFPGLDMLGMGFEKEGFCVVRGPDVLWGGDVRDFYPPRGVFDGVIGGDPCQSHSALANLVRAKGLEPSFPDMTAEFERIVNETRPRWFLRENVPAAPDIAPEGFYGVCSFLLDNCWLDDGTGMGQEQMRRRRFWFGLRGRPNYDLRKHLDFACFELPEPARTVAHEGGGEWYDQRNRTKRQSVTHRPEGVPVKLGGSGKVKATAVQCDTGVYKDARRCRHSRYPLAEMLRLQGLSADALKHAPFTELGKRKLIGNGVPIPMARALARAVRAALA